MVAPESCKKDVLAKARHLKKLSIQGKMEAFLESRSGSGISNLEELKCLEHLKLLNDGVYMSKTVQLPSAFFRLVRTVKKLTLANTRFQWSEVEKLAQLESLEVLKLKKNAFMSDTWKPEVGGFINLQRSNLQKIYWNIRKLKTWYSSSAYSLLNLNLNPRLHSGVERRESGLQSGVMCMMSRHFMFSVVQSPDKVVPMKKTCLAFVICNTLNKWSMYSLELFSFFEFLISWSVFFFQSLQVQNTNCILLDYYVKKGPPLKDDEVFGFDEEANKVIKRLVEGPAESLDIIPLVGMPGHGKTTLAGKIYNYSTLTFEFYQIHTKGEL
ncbi:hypothetical protein MTR67_016153 [Solanum verrucosum]|uniref:NB-ARC domain-containing protein n=1 Tax=Solanum verrucosum TaxID=315347 RepID=A0AAF0QGR3_SOLVR|nr:hypothetical protein MTR67_016153 [Solanum verrucosum]